MLNIKIGGLGCLGSIIVGDNNARSIDISLTQLSGGKRDGPK